MCVRTCTHTHTQTSRLPFKWYLFREAFPAIILKMMDLFFCPHFIHAEKDLQKLQAMYEERTQQNMVTWRARAESALRKTPINNVKLC